MCVLFTAQMDHNEEKYSKVVTIFAQHVFLSSLLDVCCIIYHAIDQGLMLLDHMQLINHLVGYQLLPPICINYFT